MARPTQHAQSPRGEAGMTLSELIVAMAILSIVMTVFLSVLASVQRSAIDHQVRSDLIDQARLALMSIDRQVRSGNLLYDPGLEQDPFDRLYESDDQPATGFLLRVYTQARLGESTQSRCVLWLVDNHQRLLTRYWEQGMNPDVAATEWRVVAEGIVNFEEETPPFVLEFGGRTVSVSLAVNPDLEHRDEATQWFNVALTGRNTSFGYPSTVCSELPDDMET